MEGYILYFILSSRFDRMSGGGGQSACSGTAKAWMDWPLLLLVDGSPAAKTAYSWQPM